MSVLAVALLTSGLAVWVAAQDFNVTTEVVRYDKESRYYRIRVVDYPRENRRCLHFSKSRGIQSSMVLDDPAALDLRYSRTMMAAMAMHPDPRDVLLVGLGGASIPKFIQKHFPDVRLDIAEIDPDVVAVCQKWFDFKGAPGTRVIVMDGRMLLKRSEKQYDVIMLDAYASDRIPFHLVTREFIELVKSRLKAGGLAASNLWEYGLNRFYWAELKTYQKTFPQTYLFHAGSSGNVIVFGSAADERIAKDAAVARAKAISDGKEFGFDLPAVVAAEYKVLTGQAIKENVLTDDMAPVDTLRHENPRTFDK
jgi:spermidine synthase